MAAGKSDKCYDLQIAIITNNVKRIEEIIQEVGVQMVSDKIRLVNRSTPLSLAVYKNCKPALDILVTYPLNLNRLSCDHLGRIEPPLCSAIRLGHKYIIEKLLSCPKLNVNQFDFFGQTPLWMAIKERRFEVVQNLIRHSSFRLNNSMFTKSKTSPLFLAAKYLKRGREEMFTLLLKTGLPTICLDTDFGDEIGPYDYQCTPGQTILFEVAVVHHSYHLIPQLVNSGVDAHMFRHKFANSFICQALQECHPRSLKSECRLLIRRQFISKLNLPITEDLIQEHLPSLPKLTRQFVSELT